MNISNIILEMSFSEINSKCEKSLDSLIIFRPDKKCLFQVALIGVVCGVFYLFLNVLMIMSY